MTFKDNNSLHVYAQYMPHHESFIVGNEKALLELKKMIDEPLQEGRSKGDFTASDGECYQAFVIKLADHEDALFESVEMAYTYQFGDENSNIFYVTGETDKDVPDSPAFLLKKGTHKLFF